MIHTYLNNSFVSRVDFAYTFIFSAKTMAKLTTHIRRWNKQVLEKIEAIRSSGDIAPDGVSLVGYFADRDNDTYYYYRLVAKDPIFEDKNGKPTKSQHLKVSTEQEVNPYRESIKRRKQIKILQKLFAQMEKSLCELEELDL